MENMNQVIDTLRTRIQALPVSASGKRMGIPEDLKRESVRIFQDGKIKSTELANRIGVSESAMRKWCTVQRALVPQRDDSKAFRHVTVESETQSPCILSGVVVEGPCGLKVKGMNLSELASLWRQLC